MPGELRYNYHNVIGRKNPTSGLYEPLSNVRIRAYKLDAAGARPGSPSTFYTTRAGGGPLTEFLTVDGAINIWLDPGDWEIEAVDQNAPQRIANMVISVQALMGKDSGLLSSQLPELGRSLCPTGTILPFAGSVAPAGWALCQGQTVDGTAGTAYANLYGVIGTNYGGSGPSTMKLPDLQGRMPVGLGTHADVNALGDHEGGDRTQAGHTLAQRKPKHAHGRGTLSIDNGGVHNHPARDGADRYMMTNSTGGLAGDAGAQPYYPPNVSPFMTGDAGNHSHTMQGTIGVTDGPSDTPAFLVVNYIIKL